MFIGNYLQDMRQNRKKGFTLLELLFVIAIIALLSSIVLANLANARQKAVDSRIAEDYIQLRNASEVYYSDHGSYPLDLYPLIPPNGNYISMPADPIDPQHNPSSPKGSGNSYHLSAKDTANCGAAPDGNVHPFIYVYYGSGIVAPNPHMWLDTGSTYREFPSYNCFNF